MLPPSIESFNCVVKLPDQVLVGPQPVEGVGPPLHHLAARLHPLGGVVEAANDQVTTTRAAFITPSCVAPLACNAASTRSSAVPGATMWWMMTLCFWPGR